MTVKIPEDKTKEKGPLKSGETQKVDYCIPIWLRNRNIAAACKRVKGRLEVSQDSKRTDPIAVVCFGPSLNETWEEVKGFKHVMTCSGSHKFLLDKLPDGGQFENWWHCLPAQAVVTTEDGPKTIKQIVDSNYRGRVLSLDAKNRLIWSSIVRSWCRSSRGLGKRWVAVNFSARGNKNNLICTDDHRVAIVGDPLMPEVEFVPAASLVGQWVIRRPYAKSPNQRENAIFNCEQVEAMVGVMLGDGHIKEDGVFRCTHGDVQRDYLNFKQRLFGGRIENSEAVAFGKNHKRGILVCPINGQTKKLRDMLYPPEKRGKKSLPLEFLKYVGEISLAYWYMDDGSLQVRKDRPGEGCALFCTDGFEKEETQRLIELMASRWGFSPRTKKSPSGVRIRLCTADSSRFFKMIAKYVPTCMEYKLPNRFRGGPKRVLSDKPLDFATSQVREVRDLPVVKGKWHGGKLYDMEVEQTHTFVADDCVVHNCEVDPRPHKIALLGKPHPRVEYLAASTCCPEYFDHLAKGLGEAFEKQVKLWHVFDSDADGFRLLPYGEWILTGGASVGLRAILMARLLGFTDVHVFGMDGCFGKSGTHAGEHPNSSPGSRDCEYPEGSGIIYKTTTNFLHCAQQTSHELNQLPDVQCTFHGEGLTQAMMKNRKPSPVPLETAMPAMLKPPLISPEYLELNRRLHTERPDYGTSGAKHANEVLSIMKRCGLTSVLDYGCGKGLFGIAMAEKGVPIWEYDPCVEGKEESPRPADIVVCTDVLEHIEPDRLLFVLKDLQRVVKKIGYFVVHTGPASKVLADGRNAHILQQPREKWAETLRQFFEVPDNGVNQVGPLVRFVVGVKHVEKPILIPGDPSPDVAAQLMKGAPVEAANKEASA